MLDLLKFFDLTPLDATMILVCIPLFVIFLKAMEKTLIRPFLARINDRDSLTVGAGSTADSTIRDAIALEEQYAKKIADARSAAIKTKLEKVNTARVEAEKIVSDSETEVAEKVGQARQKTKDEIAAQRNVLMGQVDTLAQSVAQKLLQPRALSTLVLFLSLALPNFAFASEAGAHGYGYLFWYWVNFLVYVTVMYFILRGMVAKGWDARRERIRTDLEAGKRSLAEALARYDAANNKLTGAAKEIEALASTIERETALEAAKILADAKAKAEKIKVEATQNLALESKSQKLTMQKEIGDLVLEKAQVILKQSVTKESDKALRDGALSGVKNLMAH